MEQSEQVTRYERDPAVGQCVVYCDPKGQDHDALVCAVWGRGDIYYGPGINLVYVSTDDSKKDQYGRQIERDATSVIHVLNPGALHGRYWRWADEERHEYVAPAA